MYFNVTIRLIFQNRVTNVFKNLLDCSWTTFMYDHYVSSIFHV